MKERVYHFERTESCPICQRDLKQVNDELHCSEHGAFFHYGPRLLVQVAAERVLGEPLHPWQTLAEK